ncbi:MAG: hypothetical protein J7647_02310 [Cyanobacteria bacterium SBLK]|nr:hypothetical protein [Cyanobacteria bacterium SBLK]
MLLELRRFDILPGQKLVLRDVTWPEFEQILEELGEKRASRIAYANGILEIMAPLPKHEVDKLFVTNFVEILLEELNIDFYPLGSTTFKNEVKTQGRNKTMREFRAWVGDRLT